MNRAEYEEQAAWDHYKEPPVSVLVGCVHCHDLNCDGGCPAEGAAFVCEAGL